MSDLNNNLRIYTDFVVRDLYEHTKGNLWLSQAMNNVVNNFDIKEGSYRAGDKIILESITDSTIQNIDLTATANPVVNDSTFTKENYEVALTEGFAGRFSFTSIDKQFQNYEREFGIDRQLFIENIDNVLMPKISGEISSLSIKILEAMQTSALLKLINTETIGDNRVGAIANSFTTSDLDSLYESIIDNPLGGSPSQYFLLASPDVITALTSATNTALVRLDNPNSLTRMFTYNNIIIIEVPSYYFPQYSSLSTWDNPSVSGTNRVKAVLMHQDSLGVWNPEQKTLSTMQRNLVEMNASYENMNLLFTTSADQSRFANIESTKVTSILGVSPIGTSSRIIPILGGTA